MRYYLDTEFNGFGGALISLALVAETGDRSLDLHTDCPRPKEWVRLNVIPHLWAGPDPVRVGRNGFGRRLADFLRDDPDPMIVCNWPDDIRHFLQAMKQCLGMILRTPIIRFELVRVSGEFYGLPGAVAHNAWWDAMALRAAVMNGRPDGLRDDMVVIVP